MEAEIEVLSKKIASLSLLKPAAIISWETRRGGHTVTDYPIVGAVPGANEQVNFVGSALHPQENPYSNTYNPRWRNHLNFSQSNTG